MAKSFLYRNARAEGLLDLFLLSAIGSLLGVRLYLHLTGYPQIGGGGLHIAHMLWGGALMMAGFAVSFAYIGSHARRLAALLGGIGFGVFIDELGKFITHDNNYFYRPAVGIIYAIFVIMYLIFNFLSRQRQLTSREYQLNALMELEEAIVHHMDATEKARAQALLAKADQRTIVTKHLQALLDNVNTVPEEIPTPVRRLLRQIDGFYQRFWRNRQSNRLVRIFFLVEVLIFGLAVFVPIYGNVSEVFDIFRGPATYSRFLVVGQLLSSVVAGLFAVYGAILLTRSRLKAFEQFRRATLVNLFLTQFFIFSRIEFGALPGFAFNLLVLGLIAYSIRQEHKSANN